MMARRTKKPGFYFVLLLFAILIPGSTAWSDSGRRYIRLTILHTNDTHSHLLPFSYPSVVRDENGKLLQLPVYRNVGGIARRATVIKSIESERPDEVLVLDAGDVLDGSPFSVEFAGEADFAAMNAAGYEVMVTGNHEYSNNLVEFKKRLQQARFPLLAANVFLPDGTPFLTPYVIKNIDGFRVAILGVVVPNNYTAVKEAQLTIKDPVQVAAEWLPKLHEEADAVILLSHIGNEDDKKLAKTVPGIAAVIGGHSHTRVPKPELVRTDDNPGAFSVGGTVVAQDFQWGSELGRVELIFRKGDAGWTLMSYGGALIPITADIPEDPVVRETVEKYHRKIAPKYDVVVGEAADDFLAEATCNLVSDALRETYKADFAVHNYGGVRTDLVKGSLTYSDIATMLPFSNSVMTFPVTGAQLKQILLSHPAVSNIRYRLEKDRLIFAEIGGQPIDDNKTYFGVTHSFFAGNAISKDISMTEVAPSIREVVVDYIKSRNIIAPDDELRAIVEP